MPSRAPEIVLLAASVALASGCKCGRATDAGAAPDAAAAASVTAPWIDTRAHDLFVVEDKRDTLVPTATAEQLFSDGFPKLKPDWRKFVTGPIEPAPHARPKPAADTPQFYPRPGDPVAVVTGYSPCFVQTKLLEPLGRVGGLRAYECLASLRIERSAKLDSALRLQRLTETFGREYRGIRQGSSPKQVRTALGEPSQKQHTKSPGYFRWYYQDQNVTVGFDNGVVKRIDSVNPQPRPAASSR